MWFLVQMVILSVVEGQMQWDYSHNQLEWCKNDPSPALIFVVAALFPISIFMPMTDYCKGWKASHVERTQPQDSTTPTEAKP
jgi:hypothetical protein